MIIRKELPVKKRIEISSLYTAFEQRMDKNFYFAGESHVFWEMVCVLEGNVGVTADDDVYSLCAGQMILHKPMEFHRLWASGGTEPVVCIFSFSATNMPTLNGRVYKMTANDQVRVKKLHDNIHEHYEMDCAASGISMFFLGVKENCEEKAYSDVCYLEYLILKMTSRGAGGAVSDGSVGARKYAEIVGVMEKNIEKRLSVEEIAAECAMSVSNVKKIFYRYSGKGVSTYFNELKIRRAIELLDGGATVNEIAMSLGFEDRNYFSTVFRRIMGQSPIKYRKDNLRGE